MQRASSYKYFFAVALVLTMTQAARAQAPSNNNLPAIAGVENPWDARIIIEGLIKDNEQFQPILNGLHPQDWIAKGASSVYIQQWQQAVQQNKDVVTTAKMLLQKSDSLSLALDNYFRLEALEVTSRSLEEAIRRYADRATADQLGALIARNFSARERFRDYIQSLATSTEQNYKVADAEAQRCRAMISKEPAPKKR
jgi:acetyl-CoA carboxylase beta subunit